MTREEMIEKIRNCAQYDEVQEEVEFLSKWYDIPLKDELGEWKNGDEMLAEIEKAFQNEVACDMQEDKTMIRHYVLIDENISNGADFETTDLGTDKNDAIAKADCCAAHLTANELKKRDSFQLCACDIPDDADIDDISFTDYVKEVVIDYKVEK